jgi:hypothetical protein
MWAIEQPDIELFDRPRRDEMLARIFALRPWWTERGGPNFHTLGHALYQDGGDRDGLTARVDASNALLREYFGEVLEELRKYIAVEVNGEARWRQGLPLPGFHIFAAGALAVGESLLQPHFDLQYEYGGFTAPPSERVISVTVPVKLPVGGASLDYWPIDLETFSDLVREGSISGTEDVRREVPPRQAWYEEGRPCLQRGLPLHRIGASRSVDPGDYRITLQCHAVQEDGAWIVYW